MRIPTSWNDASLLDDEPFMSLFVAFTQTEGRTRSECQDLTANVLTRISEELTQQDGIEAAEAWLRLVFAKSSRESHTASAHLKADTTGLQIFIDYYHKLYQERRLQLKQLHRPDDSASVRFIRNLRSDRGYLFVLPSTGDLDHVEVIAPKKAQKAQKTQKVQKARNKGQKKPRRSHREDVYHAETEDYLDAPDNSIIMPKRRPNSAITSSERAVGEQAANPRTEPTPQSALQINSGALELGLQILTAHLSAPHGEPSHLSEPEPSTLDAGASVSVSGKRKSTTERPLGSSSSESDMDLDSASLINPPSFHNPRHNHNHAASGAAATTYAAGCTMPTRRQLPRRTAANRDKLSMIVRRETEYAEQNLRGYIEDPREEPAVPAEESLPQETHPQDRPLHVGHKGKKLTKNRPSTPASSMALSTVPPYMQISGKGLVSGKRSVGRQRVPKRDRKGEGGILRQSAGADSDLPSQPNKKHRKNRTEVTGALAVIAISAASTSKAQTISTCTPTTPSPQTNRADAEAGVLLTRASSLSAPGSLQGNGRVNRKRARNESAAPPPVRFQEPIDNVPARSIDQLQPANKGYTPTAAREGMYSLASLADVAIQAEYTASPLFHTRPSLPCKPPIWAQSRQEVCESFDWFRSYQGGVYFMKDLVKGYLLSAFSSKRDLFAHDGRLIISHGGGKAESMHAKEGELQAQEADDQLAGDKSVRALLNTFHLGRPVVLLIDDKYSLFPYDLASDGYAYVVLGFYRIVHAWAEKQPATNIRGHVVRYKFAFQWCEEQGNPWWILSTNTVVSSREEQVSASSVEHGTPPVTTASPDQTRDRQVQRCSACDKTCPIIYTIGWMCLHPGCPAFWKIGQHEAFKDGLKYTDTFLQLVPIKPDRLEDLRPPLPATKSVGGITTSRVFCKGWHCSQCGRLSSRYKWEHWECLHCGATHKVSGRIRDPKDFWGQKRPPSFDLHRIAPDSGITTTGTHYFQTGGAGTTYEEFVLPHNRGRIVLISARQIVNSHANDIFKEYQEQAANGELLFRRWPLKAHKCRGALLTNYFSQNTGEPYQYVGGTTNTVAWSAAPSAVSHALDLIKQRVHDALGMSPPFNEVLSAAYMEKQSMAFHSDSEKGLGPVVASLSLGSAAYMHFRLLNRYTNETGKGTRTTALTLYLKHGDVLVMDGEGVQKYYEHTVQPMNFRIAATARSIDSRNHQT